MGGLFHGWRNKFGVVTLAMALMFVGGWIRSVVGDVIEFPNSQHIVALESHSLTLGSMQIQNSNAEPGGNVNLASNPTMDERIGIDIDLVPLVVIPYWSILLTLSLVAASLLLVQPRAKTPTTADKAPCSSGVVGVAVS
ncbi:MAG: hypothetical protein V4719_16970 [Planctomycetota bacterium]